MRLVITTYWARDKKYKSTCSYPNAGYKSVAEMRKELRRRFSKLENIHDINGGVYIARKSSHSTEHAVTLE